MGRLGLLARLFPGAALPTAAAGEPSSRRGVGHGSLLAQRESLATQCTEAETALALQGLGSYPVLQSGTDEQVQPVAARGGRRGRPWPRSRCPSPAPGRTRRHWNSPPSRTGKGGG